MNRADRLYEVLKDGKPHSRQQIFERGGFYLSNNAASELRARGRKEGFDIVHTCQVRVVYGRPERTDYYTLVSTSAQPSPSGTDPALPLSGRVVSPTDPLGEESGALSRQDGLPGSSFEGSGIGESSCPESADSSEGGPGATEALVMETAPPAASPLDRAAAVAGTIVASPSLDSEGAGQLALLAPEPTPRERFAA